MNEKLTEGSTTKTSDLSTLSLTALAGVGAKTAANLAKLGLHSVADLLFHFPQRYQDRTIIKPISALRPDDECWIVGTLASTQVQFGKKRNLICELVDGEHKMGLRFFYFSSSQQKNLAVGNRIACFGQVRFVGRRLEMIHPEYNLLQADELPPTDDKLTPIYPLTDGVKQNSLRRLITQAFQWLQQGALCTDWLQKILPDAMRTPNLIAALHNLHFPKACSNLEENIEYKAACLRLTIEEIVAQQLRLRQYRHIAQQQTAPTLLDKKTLTKPFIENLPFTLTQAQVRVAAEICADMQQPYPMQRLVQGDVGSGKTVIAALALLQAVENDQQAALMAPTELLAEQHLQQLTEWFSPLGIDVVCLTGKLNEKQKSAIHQQLANGEISVVVGTHALVQKNVEFAKLGVIVIDEQHRFGVGQRLSLARKTAGSLHPHQLTMSATPIPRTLAMTAYSDLDCSILDELPPGRTPITSIALADTRRDDVINRLQIACQDKRQAYWICTLVEESETLQCQAATHTAEQLKHTLNGINVGLVHGQMKSQEKEAVMQAFHQGDIEVLVATTVVEVGVNVPNASLMIIENPERLGLAQLHQLRGRVGRGSIESFCVLMYHAPLSKRAYGRLEILRRCHDGFEIAEYDMQTRGHGEIFGTRQSGLSRFKIADLNRDSELFVLAQQIADTLLQSSEYKAVIPALLHRWQFMP